jgi:hypothetical protein
VVFRERFLPFCISAFRGFAGDLILLMGLTLSRVTSKLMFPFKEDLVRFDFEVQAEDEWMCDFVGEGARG